MPCRRDSVGGGVVAEVFRDLKKPMRFSGGGVVAEIFRDLKKQCTRAGSPTCVITIHVYVKKTSICPQCLIFIMLGVQVVGHAVIWSLAGRVAQCCGSYAQFFFLENTSRFYNYLFALNEKNLSSFSSVISGCWYD